MEIRRIHATLSYRTAVHELPELGLVWKPKVKNFPSGCRAEALGSSPDGWIWTPTALLTSAINHRPGKPPDGSTSQCIPVMVPSIKPRLGSPALITKVKQANGQTKSVGVTGRAALPCASWFGLCRGEMPQVAPEILLELSSQASISLSPVWMLGSEICRGSARASSAHWYQAEFLICPRWEAPKVFGIT